MITIQFSAYEDEDSRLRASCKNSWRRDVLRAKGVIDSYCLIDVQALRWLQSSHRPLNKSFKPVTDRFVMSHERTALSGRELV